ncbi:hypothetical protein [Streptomyces sp. Qhu_M48]|uniref:hypothetical protein n=1 Tax=Streptomyces sp. Qhu_M48 TaxID=3435889 RepID=UPI003F50915E
MSKDFEAHRAALGLDEAAAQVDKGLESGFRAGGSGRRQIAQADRQQASDDHAHHWWIELDLPVATAEHQGTAAMAMTGLRDGFGTADPPDLLHPVWHENAGDLDTVIGLLLGHRPPVGGMEQGDR